jgi:hypothetical protein
MASAARKPVPVLEPVIPPNLVDTFGDLAKLREDFAPTERKYQHALAGLRELVAEADDATAFSARGERYTLQISARGMEAKPNVWKVRKLLTKTAFMKVVTITKTALEKFLLKGQIEAACDVTQTGSRKFEAVPLAAARSIARPRPAPATWQIGKPRG